MLTLYCFRIQCRAAEGDRTVCTELVGLFSETSALKEFAKKTAIGEKVWFSCRPSDEEWRQPKAVLKPGE